VPGSASVTGPGNISANVRVHNLTLAIQVDGGGLQRIILRGKPILSSLSTGWTFPHTSTLALLVNGQTVTAAMVGVADLPAVVAAINVASVAATGYSVAYRALVTGIADPAGTYLGLWVGAAPTTTIETAEVSVVSDTGVHAAEMFPVIPVGGLFQSNDKTGLATVVDPIQTQINNAMNETIATIDIAFGNFLVLTSSASGHESKIEIHGAPTGSADLLLALGLTAGNYYGRAFKVRSGDEVWADCGLLGLVTEVQPGGVAGRLRLGTEQNLTATWSSWYIVAKNLANFSGTWGSVVPTPDFYVDTAGDVNIKHDFLRDGLGAPIGTASVGLYLTYSAVRKDVTGSATTATPSLLYFDDFDELEDALGPVTPDNPLAYGIYIAMSNAANVQIAAIGVDEISADSPFGTVTAFGKAFDFLETQEVYALSILTNDPLVHQLAAAHIDAMNLPAAKAERVAIICQDRPTREYDEIAASGTNGESYEPAPGVYKFNTNNVSLSSALVLAGIDPTAIVVADGVYLDIAYDSRRWNITGAVEGGTIITINKTFTPVQNADDFYYDGADAFPDVLDETYSVKIRGASIPDTTAGRVTEVETYVNIGQGYANRKVWFMVLNGAYASVEGTQALVDGFYLTAAKAGMVAGNIPSAPFTNAPISGFTKVVGTNDRYKSTQLNQIAAGGCDVIIQNGRGSPLSSRHQLTTDMTSIETREQSIVKAVDFCAKFIRTGLRTRIGQFNITQPFLTSLSTVVQAQLKYLIENKIVAGGELNTLTQDVDNPDTVIADVILEVLYPCNYIRVTLIV
jgi:hypothetical protein